MTLLVLHAVGLHLRDGVILEAVELAAGDDDSHYEWGER